MSFSILRVRVATLNLFWLFRVPLGIQKSFAIIGGRRLVALELEGDLPARMDALRSTGGRELHLPGFSSSFPVIALSAAYGSAILCMFATPKVVLEA